MDFFPTKDAEQIARQVFVRGPDACRWQMESLKARLAEGRVIKKPYSYWLTLLGKNLPLLADVEERRCAEQRLRAEAQEQAAQVVQRQHLSRLASERARAEEHWATLDKTAREQVVKEAKKRYCELYPLFATRCKSDSLQPNQLQTFHTIELEVLGVMPSQTSHQQPRMEASL